MFIFILRKFFISKRNKVEKIYKMKKMNIHAERGS